MTEYFDFHKSGTYDHCEYDHTTEIAVWVHVSGEGRSTQQVSPHTIQKWIEQEVWIPRVSPDLVVEEGL